MTNITICIIDYDCYFIFGLKSYLSNYFYDRNIQVFFLPEDSHENASLVFYSNGLSSSKQFCRFRNSTAKQIVINIQDCKHSDSRMRKQLGCARELIFIDRRICLYRLKKKLNYILKSFENPSRNRKCSKCTVILSKGEWQLLFSLQQGLTTKEIALKLNLSLKSISATKRRAMDKLGLSRNFELYHWLTQNRLEQIPAIYES